MPIFSTGTYAGIGIVCQVWKCYEKYQQEKKCLKWKKRLKTAKKLFWPALGCAQRPKAGWNTQQLGMTIGMLGKNYEIKIGFCLHSTIPSLTPSHLSGMHLKNKNKYLWLL